MKRFSHNQYTVSQNFTTSPYIISKLKEHLPRTTPVVVDIGAGKGAITTILLQYYSAVIALEPDKRLVNPWKNEMPSLHWIPQEFSQKILPSSPFDVVANIPFSKTAQILTTLLKMKEFTSGLLILQKEAAEKFAGKQLHARQTYQSARTYNEFIIEKVITCKPTDFSPVPRVPIIIISIRRRAAPLIQDFDQFYDFLAYIFNKSVPIIQKAFPSIKLGVLGQRVISTITFEELNALYTQTRQYEPMYRGYVKKIESEAAKIKKIFRTRRDSNWKAR